MRNTVVSVVVQDEVMVAEWLDGVETKVAVAVGLAFIDIDD